jgi:hypothetical protein
MKTLYTAIITLVLSASCWAWSCPTNQHWVQVAPGTPGTTVVEGITFQCQPNTPPVTPPNVTDNHIQNNIHNKNTNNNTSSSNSSASSNQSQDQTQKQSQSQVATGGNASSTSAATENGNNSNNTTVEAPKIPVSTAIAPTVFPTVPCLKGYGGAVQTGMFGGSFGGGKIDEGCDQRELARSFSGVSKVAQCKILVNTKAAKKAGVTMLDCMGPAQEIVPEPVAPVIVVTPAPLVLVAPTYVIPSPVRVHKKRVVHHMRPDCQNVVQQICKGEK